MIEHEDIGVHWCWWCDGPPQGTAISQLGLIRRSCGECGSDFIPYDSPEGGNRVVVPGE